jgi:hypothetical protein
MYRVGARALGTERYQADRGDLKWLDLREQLSACAAAAAVALVVTGPLGGVLRGYSQPGLQRAGALPPLP